MLRCRLLVGCLFVSLCAASVHAATYYVAPNGSDSAAGTLSAPWLTLTTSVRKLASGDTLYLRAGTYTGGLYITQTNVTLQAYTGETVVIDGSAAGDNIYFEYTASGCVLRNLDCVGGSTYVVMFATNHTDPANSTGDIGASNILIENCKLHGSGYIAAKLTQSCNNDTFRGCEIFNEPSLGIDAVASSNMTVEDCYIHDTQGEGVYAKGGSSGIVIQRNHIVNTACGILLGQSTGYPYFQLNKDPNLYECIDSVARDNIIVNTTYAGIGTYSSLRCAFYNNTVVNAATTGQAGIFVVGATHPDAPAGMQGAVLCSQLQIRNNIIVLASGNTRPIVFLTANSYADTPVFSNNRYYKAGAAASYWDEENVIYASFASWVAHIGETGSSEGDPSLDANQHLLSTSACIDKGMTITSFNFDYDKQTRPSGAAWDIGADEYISTPTNVPPVIASAAKASPSSAQTGQAVSFSVSATDADGDTLTYSWNFGDSTTGSGATTSHTYSKAGTFSAVATISDGHGHSITSSTTVTITAPTTNVPPVIASAAKATPSSAQTGQAVSFTVSATDADGDTLTYAWNFGDSTTGSGTTTSHTYSKAATFTAVATISDGHGHSITSSTTVTITAPPANVPPVLSSAATASPASAQTGQAIAFAVAATDADGDALTYTWAFGDGTSGSGATASHSYTAAGTYTATATINDGHGHSITSSVAVTITAAPPPTAIRINSGGPASGTFAADNSVSGGSTYKTTHAINTSAANAAPAAVYQSERYGNFTYTIGGLTAGTAYTVRLHFAEIYWSSTGKRVFNVAINGQQVLANFDIYAAAGGNFIALVKSFTATANGSGQIVIAYTTVKDNAKSSGIEVLSQSIATRALARDAATDTGSDGSLELSSIDLGTVHVGAAFKLKLELPESGRAASKLKFRAVNAAQLPTGVRASGPYLGGKPKMPGTYTFQLQFQSGDGVTLVNTYTLTVAP